MTTRPHPATHAARAALAAATTAALLLGVPWLLTHHIGWPLPRHLPTTRAGWHQWLTNPPIDPAPFTLHALACALWLSWAQFLCCTLTEAWHLLHHQTPHRPPRYAIRPIQRLTAGLLGAITLTLLTRAVPAKATPGPLTPDTDTSPATAGAAHDGPPAANPAEAAVTPGSYWTRTDLGTAGRDLHTYQVREHDSLWRIAEHELGDPLRWKDIYALNHDRPQPGGERLAGPYYLIRPGWTLLLPPPPLAGRHPQQPAGRSAVVHHADTLSLIARRELGNAERWPELFDLNRDRPQPDGRRLEDPDLIQPGWTLTLPADNPHRGRPDSPGTTGNDPDTTAPRRPGNPAAPGPERPSPAPPAQPTASPSSTAPPSPTAPPSSTAPPATAPPMTATGTAAGAPGVAGATTGSTARNQPPLVAPTPAAPSSTAPQTTAPPVTATGTAAAAPGAVGATSGSTAGNRPPLAAPTPAAPSVEPEVRLPTGGVVGLSVAAGVSTAVALWRRRSRVHRRPTTGAVPDADQPRSGPTAPPRAATGGADTGGAAEAPQEPQEPATAVDLDRAWWAAVRRAARDTEPDPQGDAEEDIESAVPSAAALGTLGVPRDEDGRPAAPPRPTCPHPAGTVPVATEAGAEVLLDVLAAGGLGLSGPGAAGVARALLAALLTGGGTLHTHVIATSQAAHLLLGHAAEALERVPGVEVIDDLDDLLRAAEAEVFGRGRLLAEAGDPTLAGYRDLDGTEPIPALVLFLDAPQRPGPVARLAGVLSIGRARDVGAVLLGPWPHGMTCHIDATAAVASTVPTDPSGTLHPGRRLHHLSAGELIDLIGGPLAAARGALDYLPPPTQPAPTKPTPVRPLPRQPAHTGKPPQPEATRTPQPTGGNPREQDQADHDDPAHSGELDWAAAAGAPVAVGVFGPLRILTGTGVDLAARFRAKLRDLLAYLAVHPAGATADQLAEALWPDADPRRAAERLSTTLAQLRRALREAGGLPREADPVPRTADRYRLDPALIATDHAAFTAALETLQGRPFPAAPGNQHSEDDPDARAARIDAARRATGIHAAGPLLDGCDFEWAEPARHAAAARLTRALAALAGDLAPDDPLQALTALHQAIDATPHEEDLYRQAMRIYGELGRLAPIRRLMRMLESHLADLDTDPEPDTTRLFHYLARVLTRPDADPATPPPKDTPPLPTDPAPP
jgi:DNA-binding SARP family transcriptional activator